MDVDRRHSFRIAETKSPCNYSFQLRTLANGGYNYIIWDEWKDGIRMVVFNNDAIFNASKAFKEALCKARKWIDIGRKNNTTLSEFKDMGIDAPCGCAVKIPNAIDKYVAFHDMADIPKHKSMKTSFEFKFTDKNRWLRLVCGEVAIVFIWSSEVDDREFSELNSRCDVGSLLELLVGRSGELAKFDVNQEYKSVPLVHGEPEEKLEWNSGDICMLSYFARNTNVTLSQCPNGGYNYSFSPYRTAPYYNTLLVFPNNSYDAAFGAIERAYRIALAWRDVARKHHVLNLDKEIEIPCPESVGVTITGQKGYGDVWRRSIEREYPACDCKRTRFWFSIQTDVCYSSYRLYFGNEDVIRSIAVDDINTAAIKLIDPQLGLMKIKEQSKIKDKEAELFK